MQNYILVREKDGTYYPRYRLDTFWYITKKTMPPRLHVVQDVVPHVVPATPAEMREVRAKYDFTQKDIARFLGISVNAVSMWEQGRRIPRDITTKIFRLAKEDPSIFFELENIQ